jgi:hypothetical protein
VDFANSAFNIAKQREIKNAIHVIPWPKIIQHSRYFLKVVLRYIVGDNAFPDTRSNISSMGFSCHSGYQLVLYTLGDAAYSLCFMATIVAVHSSRYDDRMFGIDDGAAIT